MKEKESKSFDLLIVTENILESSRIVETRKGAGRGGTFLYRQPTNLINYKYLYLLLLCHSHVLCKARKSVTSGHHIET